MEKQLLYAGITLAAVLERLFGTPAPQLISAPPVPLRSSITADEAINFVGKKVTVCTKVFTIKSLDKVSFINVGARFPNSPLTIVIFVKDRDKFIPSIEELYVGKFICIKGTVELYKGKAEIIITKPDDIIIQ